MATSAHHCEEMQAGDLSTWRFTDSRYERLRSSSLHKKKDSQANKTHARNLCTEEPTAVSIISDGLTNAVAVLVGGQDMHGRNCRFVRRDVTT
eukprot:676337-Pleurochrysis_carterae.AAC.3